MRRDIDRAVLDIGMRQFGAIGRTQASEVGAYDRLLHRRVRAGELLQPSDRVFVLPAFKRSFEQDLWVATLDCEGRSFVSHESAARLDRLPSFTAAPEVVLTIPHGDKRTPLATCHQTRRSLDDISLRMAECGLPIPTLPLIVAQLAAVISAARLEMVVDHVLTQRQLRFDLLVEAWRDARARHLDVRPLGALLARLGPGSDLPTSVLNKRLHHALALVPGGGIAFEVAFPGHELPTSVVDALIRPELIIVEGDGRSWHSREKDFARDRKRDRAAGKAGCLPVRFTYQEMGDVADVVEELTELRIQRRRDLGLRPLELVA